MVNACFIKVGLVDITYVCVNVNATRKPCLHVSRYMGGSYAHRTLSARRPRFVGALSLLPPLRGASGTCEGIAWLGGHPEEMQQTAKSFGDHVGLAFQVRKIQSFALVLLLDPCANVRVCTAIEALSANNNTSYQCRSAR